MRASFAFALGLAVLAAVPARADLGLPSHPIVVRDFAKVRQDLLDTLTVNLPDCRVELEKFRGAEVIVTVVLERDPLPKDMPAALEELRRHVDRVVRMAVQGMFLSKESKLIITKPHGARFAFRLGGPDAAPGLPPADSLAKGKAEEPAPAPPPPDPGLAADVAAAPTLTKGSSGDDRLYAIPPKGPAAPASPLAPGGLKAYLAAVSGAVPTAPGAPARREAPSAGPHPQGGVSPETLQALELYAAEPVPEETGRVRKVLEERVHAQALLEKVKRSDGVSRDTLAKLEQFQEAGRILEQGSSQDTVRSIYRSIHTERRPAGEVIALADLVDEGPPPFRPTDGITPGVDAERVFETGDGAGAPGADLLTVISSTPSGRHDGSP